MIKKIIAFFVFAIFAVVTANAQMTDEQVVDYVKQQSTSGASQKQIAASLLSKGVKPEQLKRIKKKYESQQQAEANNASTPQNTDVKRDRVNNGQLIPDEFELVELEDSKEEKKIFGHDIFRARDLSFEASMNVSTPSDYLLGPGDEVILDIYGTSQVSTLVKIAPDGSITIPNEGPIDVAGMTLAQAQSKVSRAIGGHYQGSNIKLSVGQTRTVMVNVMGEVNTPGTYTLSAFSTVFNALYMAGGVNEIGTLRNIVVSRQGKVITTVDVYDYIVNGRLSGNVTLKDNDVILVGPYVNLVKVEGNIKRPMYYEMKQKESLQSLLNYTGGFTGDAYKQNVRVERKSDDGLMVYNVDNQHFATFEMADGDVALIDSVVTRMKNTVTITGAVFRPGHYKLGDPVIGVRSLVKQAGGLLEDAFVNRAVLHRMKEDRTLSSVSINLAGIISGAVPDVILQNEDELIINSNEELNIARILTITGDVFKPGEYVYSEGETVEDLIMEAGGLKESASLVNVEVARRVLSASDNPDGQRTATIYNLNLKDGLAIEGETGFKLRPYDVVNIYRNPDFAEQHLVFMSGEVKFAGSYIMSSKQQRLSEIVRRAGGLTTTAYVEGAQLIRKISEKEYQLQLKKLEVAQNAADSAKIEKSLEKMTYNVGIDLAKAIKNPGSSYDIVLQHNDSIYVPKLNNTVKISGEVLFPNTVAFVTGKSVSYYLNQAGGVSEKARKRRAYIVYPNGQVSKARNGVVQPGCEIVVPTKEKKELNPQTASVWVGGASALSGIVAVLISVLK